MAEDPSVGTVYRRARHLARLEGRLEGATDACDRILAEFKKKDFAARLSVSPIALEILQIVLGRVLDDLVGQCRREHAETIERFVREMTRAE